MFPGLYLEQPITEPAKQPTRNHVSYPLTALMPPGWDCVAVYLPYDMHWDKQGPWSTPGPWPGPVRRFPRGRSGGQDTNATAKPATQQTSHPFPPFMNSQILSPLFIRALRKYISIYFSVYILTSFFVCLFLLGGCHDATRLHCYLMISYLQCT